MPLPTIMLAIAVFTTLTLVAVSGRHINGFNTGYNPMYNEGMFQGDIHVAGISSHGKRNAIVDMRKLWPNAIVPYVIGETAVGITNLILEGMEDYHKKTCIKFVPWETGMIDFVKIEVLEGCWSASGRIRTGEQKLSLGKNCDLKGIVVHELGHAIGLLHEQSRSDRDDYIEILQENIQDDRIQWFEKVKPWENFLLDEPFDYKSIMLYEEDAFSKNGNDTIRVKQPNTVIGNAHTKTGLSDSDVRRVNRLYECFGEKRPKLPDVPDIKCDFEYDDCHIKNQENMGTYFERVNNTVGGRVGTHLEVLKGPASVAARIITPYWETYGRPKKCFSFEYYSDGKAIRQIRLYQQGATTILLHSLQTNTNNRWIKIKKQIGSAIPGSSRFFIDVIFDSRYPDGRVALDNFVFSVYDCE